MARDHIVDAMRRTGTTRGAQLGLSEPDFAPSSRITATVSPVRSVPTVRVPWVGAGRREAPVLCLGVGRGGSTGDAGARSLPPLPRYWEPVGPRPAAHRRRRHGLGRGLCHRAGMAGQRAIRDRAGGHPGRVCRRGHRRQPRWASDGAGDADRRRSHAGVEPSARPGMEPGLPRSGRVHDRGGSCVHPRSAGRRTSPYRTSRQSAGLRPQRTSERLRRQIRRGQMHRACQEGPLRAELRGLNPARRLLDPPFGPARWNAPGRSFSEKSNGRRPSPRVPTNIPPRRFGARAGISRVGDDCCAGMRSRVRFHARRLVQTDYA